MIDPTIKERGPSSYFLYEFKVSETSFIRYTDADEDVQFDGNLYAPEQVLASEVIYDGTIAKTAITLTLPAKASVARYFTKVPQSFVIEASIFESNFDDVRRETTLFWSGRIINGALNGLTLVLSGELAATSLQRSGLTRNYQKPCPHALYGGLCNATRVEQAVTWVSTSPDGLWTVSQPASGYEGSASYAGGVLHWNNPDGTEQSHTVLTCEEGVGVLVLSLSAAPLMSGTPTSLRLVKGCDHTEEACSLWHDNIQNYGGFLFIPDSSPVNKTHEFL
jgi:hypothetical protein